MSDEFVEELMNTIVEWIYSSEKYQELINKVIKEGRLGASAAQYVGRKAKQKLKGISEMKGY